MLIEVLFQKFCDFDFLWKENHARFVDKQGTDGRIDFGGDKMGQWLDMGGVHP